MSESDEDRSKSGCDLREIIHDTTEIVREITQIAGHSTESGHRRPDIVREIPQSVGHSTESGHDEASALVALRQDLEPLFENTKTSGRMMHTANERFAFLEAFHFEIGNHGFDVMFQMVQMPNRISWTMSDAEQMIPTYRIRMTYSVSWIESFSSFRCFARRS
jgi:hypothetical protein